MLELGVVAKDIVTGFEGRVTGFCKYLTGCDQYLLSPSVSKEGNYIDGKWFDKNRLRQVGGDKIVINTIEDSGPGESAPIY